jgi:hypothetical protein
MTILKKEDFTIQIIFKSNQNLKFAAKRLNNELRKLSIAMLSTVKPNQNDGAILGVNRMQHKNEGTALHISYSF